MRRILRPWRLAAGVAVLAMASTVRADDTPGPIDSLQDLQDTGRMIFKLADENNDGQISQKEAIDAGNLVVGGFFFRADANGDGTLSKEEATQARETFLAQKPMLRVLLSRAKGNNANTGNNANAGNNANGSTNPNPAAMLGNLLDSNNDKQLQASEIRQAVQSTVQTLFATADTNRDGQMSPTEVNAALVSASRALAQASFQAADSDNNGQISQTEFDKAIIEPSHAVFRALDANGDGQISQQEAQSVQRVLMSRMRNLYVPEPANSPRHQIQSGLRPAEGAQAPATPTTRPGQAAPAQGTDTNPAPTPR